MLRIHADDVEQAREYIASHSIPKGELVMSTIININGAQPSVLADVLASTLRAKQPDLVKRIDMCAKGYDIHKNLTTLRIMICQTMIKLSA